MASPSQVREGLTLEEFLLLPEEKPYLEYIDGRIEAKVSPQKSTACSPFACSSASTSSPSRIALGWAFPEPRCTFEGRSIVPDVAFLLKVHIELDALGEPLDETPFPPDIHIEIISPDQPIKLSHDKLLHSTANGCPLGWLIHPYKKTIDVYRPGRPPERLALEGVLEGEPVLPGLALAGCRTVRLVEARYLTNPRPRPLSSMNPEVAPGPAELLP